MNTADLIRVNGADLHTVACVHDGYVHVCGYPPLVLSIEKCELVSQASEDDRIDLLRKMARVGGQGHRPTCARETLRREGIGDGC